MIAKLGEPGEVEPSLPTQPSGSIFLSHYSKEKKIAYAVRDFLAQSMGTPPAIVCSSDSETFPQEKDWYDWILFSIRKSKLAIFFLTPVSTERFWIGYELSTAKLCDVDLILLGLFDLPKNDLPVPLLSRSFLEATSLEDAEKFIAIVKRKFGEFKIDSPAQALLNTLRQSSIDVAIDRFVELIVGRHDRVVDLVAHLRSGAPLVLENIPGSNYLDARFYLEFLTRHNLLDLTIVGGVTKQVAEIRLRYFRDAAVRFAEGGPAVARG
jgi:hypothetical protein